ncbi:MAG: glycosyltransferase family 4 protein [Halococcoides sp.]
MRVCHYLEFADQLDRSGIGTSVDHQRRALADTPIEVTRSPWRGGGPLGGARALATARSPLADVDVVHLNVIGPASLAVALSARARSIPLVLHAHVTREDFRDSFRGSNHLAGPLGAYLKRFYSLADLVLCPSEYTRETLREYPIDAPIRPITNGIDIDSLDGFQEFREPTREKYDLDGLVVFSVGNVFERKGLSTFGRLAEETDYEFAWFGPYDSGPQASAAVREWTSDPPDNLTFTGWVEDKRAAFGAGDIYCFPTKVENQGIAVLEAMATGKPCVLRDLPVFREYFEDGEDCLLCETHEEFREALDRLASDPALRERLGENARKTAREHDLDRVGVGLEQAYRDVIAGDPDPDRHR